MNRVRAAFFGHVEDPVDDEITLRRLRRSDPIGMVGILHMKRLAVSIGVDRDGLDIKLAAGAGNANSDFAAVSD